MVITFLWQVHSREREGANEKNFIYSITHNWQLKLYVPEEVKGSWGRGGEKRIPFSHSWQLKLYFLEREGEREGMEEEKIQINSFTHNWQLKQYRTKIYTTGEM